MARAPARAKSRAETQSLSVGDNELSMSNKSNDLR